MTRTLANAILIKLDLPVIRAATLHEQRTDEYGVQTRWVFGREAYQALKGYATIDDAWRAALTTINEFPPSRFLALTPVEYRATQQQPDSARV
jgi:hypothetical protein